MTGVSVHPAPGLLEANRARPRRLIALALVVLLLPLSLPAAAQSEEVVPADYASILLLRVLAYDRTLPARCHGKLVVAVVYDPKIAESVRWKDQLFHALSQVGPRLPVRKMTAAVAAIPFAEAEAFSAALGKGAVSVAVLGPGLGPHVGEVVRATRRLGALSVGVSRSYLLEGVSLGLLVGPSRKAKVLVNVAASKAEGVEFEAGLLRFAELL